MPEIVQTYLDSNTQASLETLIMIRKKQTDLLESYKGDFVKHSGLVNASHILYTYESVCTQLAKSFDDEVDKFTVSNVVPKHK